VSLDQDDPRIGSELAGYLIEAVVGRGGMGVVYRAKDLRLGRKVALKLLTPDLAANEGFRDRFEWESKLAASIDHPNIIPLYDAGAADGLLFLTMRFVDGMDLKGLLEREGPLPFERAVSIAGQVAGALDAAHARGLVHRDVKPANVLVRIGAGVDGADHCYLTDFGLTKDTSSTLQLTGPGEFVGTIDYVAPEQIQGLSLGGPADQYALGCVLYQLVVGERPFVGDTDLDVLWAHLNEDPPVASASRADLPRGFDAVLAKAMAKSPDDRFASCSEMASAARATLGSRWRRRSR
jgi:serine/threonine-protein kinase